jgi:hypothetical protein
MNKSSIVSLAAGVCLFSSTITNAQPSEPEKMFFNVNAGAQMQSHDLTASSTFPIYNQTASVNTAQTVESGAFLDLNVGARVWGDIGIGLGFASFKDSSNLAGAASIPHPLFFNRPETRNFSAGSDHKERNIYLVALWFYSVTDRIDVAFSAGPSFTRVRHTVLSNVVVPPGSQDVFPVLESQSGWAKGGTVGFDGTYLLTNSGYSLRGVSVRPGLGVFLRYNGGSVRLPSGAEIDAGGFQGGAGLRLRF